LGGVKKKLLRKIPFPGKQTKEGEVERLRKIDELERGEGGDQKVQE